MYSYENHNKVKEQIQNSRQRALSEAKMRTEMLRLESEEFRKTDDELSATGITVFKAACKGEDIEPIKKRNLELQEKKKKLLVKMGYPADYTEPVFSCKKCSDYGYTESGALCSCFKEALIKARISSSGMGNILEKQGFENFDCERYEGKSKETMKRTLQLAKQYVESFSESKGNLLLIGPTGTGKTHISSAIAGEIIKKGYDVIYDSVQNIVSDFEDEKFRRAYSERDALTTEKYLECDLLIIDDLGTEFSNSFTVSCLYNLLNTRQNRGLATIISTNLSPKELASKYEDRIYSRIIGVNTTTLLFDGKDYRIERITK